MLNISHLLALADEYERASGVEDKTLSFRIFSDSKKLSALRESSDITTGRFNAAIRWFAENWPAGAIWPETISRPSVPLAQVSA